jgi:hypothetical protein
MKDGGINEDRGFKEGFSGTRVARTTIHGALRFVPSLGLFCLLNARPNPRPIVGFLGCLGACGGFGSEKRPGFVVYSYYLRDRTSFHSRPDYVFAGREYSVTSNERKWGGSVLLKFSCNLLCQVPTSHLIGGERVAIGHLTHLPFDQVTYSPASLVAGECLLLCLGQKHPFKASSQRPGVK